MTIGNGIAIAGTMLAGAYIIVSGDQAGGWLVGLSFVAWIWGSFIA